MKRKLRIVRAAVLLAVVALVLSACGGGGGQTSGGGAQTGSGAHLLIWTGGGPGGEATKKLGEAWGKENGVNVAVQLVPENLQTQFVTASQAGKAPDVVMGAHDWIGNLVQNGAIDPMQMTEDTRAAYEKLAIKAVTFNGQIYGVPYTIENIVLIRNTDLAPEAPSTIEDLVATGKQLKAAGKTSEILALPVGPERRRLPHLPALHLRRRLPVRPAAGRRLRPQGPRGRQAELRPGLREDRRAG